MVDDSVKYIDKAIEMSKAREEGFTKSFARALKSLLISIALLLAAMAAQAFFSTPFWITGLAVFVTFVALFAADMFRNRVVREKEIQSRLIEIKNVPI